MVNYVDYLVHHYTHAREAVCRLNVVAVDHLVDYLVRLHKKRYMVKLVNIVQKVVINLGNVLGFVFGDTAPDC